MVQQNRESDDDEDDEQCWLHMKVLQLNCGPMSMLDVFVNDSVATQIAMNVFQLAAGEFSSTPQSQE